LVLYFFVWRPIRKESCGTFFANGIEVNPNEREILRNYSKYKRGKNQ
jgi:hypothetical protein